MRAATMYREGLDKERRRLVVAALEQTAGNRTRAAAFLGITRESLYRLVKNLGLDDAVAQRWPSCGETCARNS